MVDVQSAQSSIPSAFKRLVRYSLSSISIAEALNKTQDRLPVQAVHIKQGFCQHRTPKGDKQILDPIKYFAKPTSCSRFPAKILLLRSSLMNNVCVAVLLSVRHELTMEGRSMY
eukprot:gb/GECG01012886.1/.p1 GENE.gb/GECG01012886.1/~~gb/GECG01012886.1/.p1  ORF type:complete len:114 (+),score=5.73 gb/GECG01012886.1/:1-342(+)